MSYRFAALFALPLLALAPNCGGGDASPASPNDAAGEAGERAQANGGAPGSESGGTATKPSQAGEAGSAAGGAPQVGGAGGAGEQAGQTASSEAGAGGAAPTPAVSVIADTYDIVELKGPRGGTRAEAINDSGLVVGRYSDGATAVTFTWTVADGIVAVSPDNGYAAPTSVNNHGVYCGYIGSEVATRTGFSSLTGKYAELPAPMGSTYFGADALNDDNVIVGGTVGTDGRGFRLSGGKYTLLGLLASGTRSYAQGINAAGVAVGFATNAGGKFEAVRFDGTAPTSLGTLGGAESYAYAINAAGSIVGDSLVQNGDDHAFYFAAGKLKDLGLLGGNYSSASSINDGELVVGDSSLASGSTAIAWTSNQGMIDLSTRLGAATGWTLLGATDVNNQGQIVGYASHDGNTVGFVMTPMP